MVCCWCCSWLRGHCSPCVVRGSGLVPAPLSVVVLLLPLLPSPRGAAWRCGAWLCVCYTASAWGLGLEGQIPGPGCYLHLVRLDPLGWLDLAPSTRPWFSSTCSTQAMWSPV